MDMKEIFNKATDWTHRRKYIKYLLWFLCFMLTVNIAGSIALAFFSKFGAAVSTFFIVFCICNFMVLLGIIGSYIFQASWETKNFLDVLPNIIPKLGGGGIGSGDDEGLTLDDLIKREE
jgi:uncharacterized BrkB/YihY/UPF0761 family membrane protein